MYWYGYFPTYVNQKDKMANAFGPIVYDLERIFLSLGETRMKNVFSEYEFEFGASAATYARRTYRRWQTGRVKMSGKVAARLLNFVPRFLSAESRYELVETLCEHHRPRLVRKVEIDLQNPNPGLRETENAIRAFAGGSGSEHLPATVIETVTWLNDNDTKAARTILANIDQRKSEIASELGRRELARLVNCLAKNEKLTGTQTIEFPQGQIQLVFKSKRTGLLGFLFS